MKRLPHRINEGLLYWIPFISSKWKMRKGKIAGREGMVNMQDFLPENRTSVRQKTNKKQNSWLDPSGANRINMPKYKLQVRKKHHLENINHRDPPPSDRANKQKCTWKNSDAQSQKDSSIKVELRNYFQINIPKSVIMFFKYWDNKHWLRCFP